VKSYDDHEAEHARLTILRLLASQAGYSANDSVLRDALESFGFRLSRDRVRVELGWLAEQRLAQLEELGPLVVATATQRGVEAAEGRVQVSGIKRPSPGA